MSMDVTLPDGTVVKGIPDGTSKAQLAEKLKSNGVEVPASWYAPPAPVAKPTARQTVEKALGGTPKQATRAALDSPYGRGAVPEAGGPVEAARAVGKLLPASAQQAVKGAGDWLDSLLTKGTGKLAGQTAEDKAAAVLKKSATDPAQAAKTIRSTQSPINTSRLATQQTAAAKSGDAGLLGLEKTTRTLPGAQERLAAEQLAPNNAVRTELLAKMARTPKELQDAVTKRTLQDRANYGKADSQFVNVDSRFNELAQRPIMQRAIKKAGELARNEDVKLSPFPKGITQKTGTTLSAPSGAAGGALPSQAKQISGRNLHYVKLALDQMLEKTPQNALGRTEMAQVAKTKADFLQWAEDRLPEYKVARQASAKASIPINRMRILQELQADARKTVGTDQTGNQAMTRASFAGALRRAEPDLVKNGVTPAQIRTLKKIGADLDMSERVNSPYIKQSGSDTIRNATAASALGKLVGGHGITAAGAKVLSKAPGLGWLKDAPPEQVKQILVDAMLDPETAARLLEKPTPGNLNEIGKTLQKYTPQHAPNMALGLTSPNNSQDQGKGMVGQPSGM